MYDVTDRWSVGGMLSVLKQTQGGKAMQFGYGMEAGYAVTSNLWFNVGYTWRGLNDKDILASEFRNRGLFFGLRYKFDENIWGSDNPRVNKALESQ
jgi:opacity protein-like surface antigen